MKEEFEIVDKVPPNPARGGGTKKIKKRVSDACMRLTGAKDGDLISREEFCYRRNISVGFWLAIVVSIINVYWVIDTAYKSSPGILRIIVLTVGVIAAFSAIGVVILSSRQSKIKKTIKLHRWVQFYCQILTVIEVGVFATARSIAATSLGGASNPLYDYMGVSLASLNLFTMAFYPLPRFGDAAIVLSFMGACGAIPKLLPGRESYDILSNMVMRIMVAAIYLLSRHDSLKMADNRRELIGATRRLAERAYRDGLTGLYNFRAIVRCLDRANGDPQVTAVGVIIMDVDEFKSYNDRYSHSAGNSALIRISERISELLNPLGLELFRYGGEEFVVLADNPSPEEMIGIACMIRDSVRSLNVEHEDSEYGVLTITCGVAIEDGENLDGNGFVTRADRQLYFGKERGKNCVAYDGKIYEQVD